MGAGPGCLSQNIQKEIEDIEYTLIDGNVHAKHVFNRRKYNAHAYHILNLYDTFDTSELDTDYNVIIANDFLEHIANPSNILQNLVNITAKDCTFFISVPNWRMGHTFINRGLFDYDNFVYFCYTHGLRAVNVYGSPLACGNPLPKLSSEEGLPSQLLDSWNWYFTFKKDVLPIHHN